MLIVRLQQNLQKPFESFYLLFPLKMNCPGIKLHLEFVEYQLDLRSIMNCI